MTCMCKQTQTREVDEYNPMSYEGDFVEDLEMMLDEIDQEGEEETLMVTPEGEEELDQEYDNETELFGPDSRVQVADTRAAPFRYVVNIDVPTRRGRRSNGSGTLIGPRTVLTAGHCLDGVKTAADIPRLRVIPGRAGSKAPFKFSRASGIVRFPGYVRGTRTDIGIIHLATPLGNNPNLGFWTRAYKKNKGDDIGTSIIPGSLPMNTGKLKVNLSGYPLDMPADPTLGCRDLTRPANRCRDSSIDAATRKAVCGTYQYRTYDLTVKLSGGLLFYMNDTCPGHSGSPVWVRRHPSMGGRVLTGVHIGATSTANAAVFIDAGVRAFIAKHLK